MCGKNLRDQLSEHGIAHPICGDHPVARVQPGLRGLLAGGEDAGHLLQLPVGKPALIARFAIARDQPIPQICKKRRGQHGRGAYHEFREHRRSADHAIAWRVTSRRTTFAMATAPMIAVTTLS